MSDTNPNVDSPNSGFALAGDSATVMRFLPGSYTAVAATAGSGDPGGDALIEIYAMP